MSDSGRAIGDCRHGRSPGWCLECLRKQIVELEAEAASLRATACQMPTATQCVRLWEADHQRRALQECGLAAEFPYGCDAIEHVAGALAASRKEAQELRHALRLVCAQHPDAVVTNGDVTCTLAYLGRRLEKKTDA